MEEPVIDEDRLSELPVSLIHYIFSFLPMRDVISTTLLSKRWENLWTTVPYLNFCETINEDQGHWTDDESRWTSDEFDFLKREKEEETFRNFVNRALILWKGDKILKFKLDIRTQPAWSLISDVIVWTHFALRNKVEELEIISVSDAECFTPQCLFSSSSIRKISLMGGCHIRLHGPPSWNQLKSLRFILYWAYDANEDLINQIMLSCPELEVLVLELHDSNTNFNITSRSLKKLKVFQEIQPFDENDPDLKTLSVCCPNLEKLEIWGMFVEFLFTDVSSLNDATLHFHSIEYETRCESACLNELGKSLEQFFSSIQHVEKLTLSRLCVQVFGKTHEKYLPPPLPNVKFLKLDLRRRIEFRHMMDLLGKFPNLKTLVIESHPSKRPPVFKTMKYTETNLPKSVLQQLKIVAISAHFSDPSIFKCIELLLKHATLLEKLVLQPRGIESSQQQKMFSEKLMSMPISSPNASVILKSK